MGILHVAGSPISMGKTSPFSLTNASPNVPDHNVNFGGDVASSVFAVAKDTNFGIKNEGGAIESITIDSVSQGAAGHFEHDGSGGLRATAAYIAGPRSATYVLNCTFSNSFGTDTAAITIVPEANTYYASDQDELLAILATDISGKTIKLRTGYYAPQNFNNYFADLTAEAHLTSEHARHWRLGDEEIDENAITKMAKISQLAIQSQIPGDHTLGNLKISYIHFSYPRRWGGFTTPIVGIGNLRVAHPVENVTIEDCVIEANHLATRHPRYDVLPPRNIEYDWTSGILCKNCTNLTIRRNLFRRCTHGISFAATNCVIEDNEFRELSADGIQMSYIQYNTNQPTTGVRIRGNIARDWNSAKYLHADCIHFFETKVNQLSPMSGPTTGNVTMDASSETSGNEAWRAADNNTATYWQASAALPQWIRIDHGALFGALGKYRVKRLVLQAGDTAALAAAAPADFKLQSSANGTTWNDELTVTGESFAVGEKKTFEVDYATYNAQGTGYQYWRIEVTATGDSNPPVIAQMEMYHYFDPDDVIYEGNLAYPGVGFDQLPIHDFSQNNVQHITEGDITPPGSEMGSYGPRVAPRYRVDAEFQGSTLTLPPLSEVTDGHGCAFQKIKGDQPVIVNRSGTDQIWDIVNAQALTSITYDGAPQTWSFQKDEANNRWEARELISFPLQGVFCNPGPDIFTNFIVRNNILYVNVNHGISFAVASWDLTGAKWYNNSIMQPFPGDRNGDGKANTLSDGHNINTPSGRVVIQAGDAFRIRGNTCGAVDSAGSNFVVEGNNIAQYYNDWAALEAAFQVPIPGTQVFSPSSKAEAIAFARPNPTGPMAQKGIGAVAEDPANDYWDFDNNQPFSNTPWYVLDGSVTPEAGQYSAAWLVPDADGGSAVTGYEAEHNINGAGFVAAPGYSSGTAYTQTGLSASDSVVVRFRAINANGAGPWATMPAVVIT